MVTEHKSSPLSQLVCLAGDRTDIFCRTLDITLGSCLQIAAFEQLHRLSTSSSMSSPHLSTDSNMLHLIISNSGRTHTLAHTICPNTQKEKAADRDEDGHRQRANNLTSKPCPPRRLMRHPRHPHPLGTRVATWGDTRCSVCAPPGDRSATSLAPPVISLGGGGDNSTVSTMDKRD